MALKRRPYSSALARRGQPRHFFGYGELNAYGRVRWFTIDPCYVFHALNAQDNGDRIVMYVMRYPQMWREGGKPHDATLWRWTLDPTTGAASAKTGLTR
jgi:carotenoid cleavage dioxygenase-like enzyme